MADEKAVIYETKEEAQYDETAKLLLAQKPFLANILVRTVKEFIGMDPTVVETLIEGEPYVSKIPVDPGFTNGGLLDEPKQITGMNSENKIRNEGVTYFDIIFYVNTADGLSKIIINIEAQKSEPSKYDVEMRGLFYAIREISSQLEREFSGQNYNDIKKVYSIWICMNEPENTLEKIYLTKEDLIGHSRWKDMYELVNVVIVRLGKTLDAEKGHELHRLLGALFLPEMTAGKKNEMLEEEFHIQMEGNRKEMLKTMCNLSQGIKEQGLEQGLKQGLEQGLKQGLEQGHKQGLEQGLEQGIEQGLEQGLEQGIEQGLEQGLEQGRIFEIFTSVQEGDYSLERGAQKLHLSISEFEKQMTEAGYQIPAEV